jgi:cytidylate kinase
MIPKRHRERRCTAMREKVEKALDSIRPYLKADGGDVQLVEITDSTVKVRLEGACGGCPMGLNLIIALDGPVAVGKSTVGQRLARRLGYCFFDTGTMYRALAWKALQQGIDLGDEEKLVDMTETTSMELLPAEEEGATNFSLSVDGQRLDREIYLPEVEAAVSLVSRIPEVRRVMVEMQRNLAVRGNIVMAGRDIGTVVLPDANLKVYLTASAEERARRRHQELLERGQEAESNLIEENLRRRDEIDSNRTVSPLKPAAEAHIVDTEGLNVEEVVERICTLTEP